MTSILASYSPVLKNHRCMGLPDRQGDVGFICCFYSVNNIAFFEAMFYQG